MKTICGILALAAVMSSPVIRADSTIDLTHRFAYGANLGWLDWTSASVTGDTANGAVIGEFVCSGYIYSANTGWINLGSGSPTNQIQYQNNSAADFGVNQDGLGNLRGYAYGANLGWINFENTGAPRVDLLTGNLSGYAWSANCGWISLTNTVAFVQTDSIQKGADTNNDGIPDAWELQNFGTTHIEVNGDPDGDGVSNLQEYLAGTDPKDTDSNLRITGLRVANHGSSVSLVWNSVSTRYYRVQKTLNLDSNSWADSGLGLIPPVGNSTGAGFSDTNAPMRFYRIQAVRPLMP